MDLLDWLFALVGLLRDENGCQRGAIRKSLRKWPELKRAVEDDLRRGDGALTRRCVDEGAVNPEWIARKLKAVETRGGA